mmetsp:Transcript_5147/g.7877  ORF Transcript_5147/g.7877 Transcript_5147/m.7877 type:complete len:571 (-) Transcript_5147:180-1892(-)
MDDTSNALDILASVVSTYSPSHRSAPEHRVSCHRCGNIRKRKVICPRPSCPHIFCERCAEKMKDEHGDKVFVEGCPVCKEKCCCSNKSVMCNRQNHCYRKCPATKGKAAFIKSEEVGRVDSERPQSSVDVMSRVMDPSDSNVSAVSSKLKHYEAYPSYPSQLAPYVRERQAKEQRSERGSDSMLSNENSFLMPMQSTRPFSLPHECGSKSHSSGSDVRVGMDGITQRETCNESCSQPMRLQNQQLQVQNEENKQVTRVSSYHPYTPLQTAHFEHRLDDMLVMNTAMQPPEPTGHYPSSFAMNDIPAAISRVPYEVSTAASVDYLIASKVAATAAAGNYGHYMPSHEHIVRTVRQQHMVGSTGNWTSGVPKLNSQLLTSLAFSMSDVVAAYNGVSNPRATTSVEGGTTSTQGSSSNSSDTCSSSSGSGVAAHASANWSPFSFSDDDPTGSTSVSNSQSSEIRSSPHPSYISTALAASCSRKRNSGGNAHVHHFPSNVQVVETGENEKKTQNCMHKAITDYEKSVIPKQTMQTDDPAASVPLRTLPLSSVGICQWPSPIDGDKASINSRSQF